LCLSMNANRIGVGAVLRAHSRSISYSRSRFFVIDSLVHILQQISQ